MIEIALLSEPAGRINEDRVASFDCGVGRVIAVADGAGGGSGAAAAAQTAVQLVGEACRRGRTDLLDPFGWCELLGGIDHALLADTTAGETTLVVAAIQRDAVAGASVGDSAAWLVTADGHLNLTSAQVRRPGVGTGNARPTGFGPVHLEGTLLLATDGLVKYASAERICRTARGPDVRQASRELIDLVRLQSGSLSDDVAVALVRGRR